MTVPDRSALVVDDDELTLRSHARVLARAGYAVETAANGVAALDLVRRGSFDVVFSDVDMPEMTGLQLLEQVRTHDLDVPVVLVTGVPTLDAATKAVEHGALRYLVKPVTNDDLVKAAEDARRYHRIAKAKRLALEAAGGLDRLVGDQAGLVATFERALASLWIAYQPIVSWASKRPFAYEALMRSKEPALPHPGAVLDAAERLGRLHDLGRIVRARAVEPLAQLPSDVLLFVNLHPRDLFDDTLLELGPASERIVLEITERASLHDVAEVHARVQRLRALGFRIAIDDLGAGYAGLSCFALLEPEICKLDMALIRDLHLSPTKQKVVRTMVEMCRELGIIVTSEGIETPEERDALLATGCDLMQGYLFARPGPAFPTPAV